jgi:hypothetical protein
MTAERFAETTRSGELAQANERVKQEVARLYPRLGGAVRNLGPARPR